MNNKLLARVVDEFIGDNPVSCVADFEGQGIDDKGNYVLGCRAGPSKDVFNLFHEMGHLAEREIPKLLEKPNFGWGYYQGKQWQIGWQSGFEPENDKSVHREKRVWAFQLSLMKHYGVSADKDYPDELYMARTAIWLPAFSIYKYNVIERKEIDALGYTESNRRACEILADDIRRLSETEFTYERFKKDWTERMTVLR